jgi:ribosome assembly protein YihI (activator of Der GTPase)
VFPIEITQEEHKALVEYRAASKNASEETTRLVTTCIDRLLKIMIKAGMPLEPTESDVSDATKVASVQPLEQFSPVEEESAEEFGQDDIINFLNLPQF